MALKQIAIALDQLVNTIFGGWADETLSARLYRTRSPFRKVIDLLFFFDKDHCHTSYLSEIKRAQLPPEYRDYG